jgi:hypothetical protein
MINKHELERMRKDTVMDYLKALTLSWKGRKTMKTLRIVGVLAEIRTGYLYLYLFIIHNIHK